MSTEPSSISDVNSYRNACIGAATDDLLFSKFRTNPDYNHILEHTSIEQAIGYLALTVQQTPHFIRFFGDFRKNDSCGGAQLHDFGPQFGAFAPSTLRYIKVLSDLVFVFGDISNFDVLEIGGGYGGQAAILAHAYPFKSYTIADLPEALALQRRYHAQLGIKNVRYLEMHELEDTKKYDLLISNYAYCEVEKNIADMYYEKCVTKSIRGYMTCNHISKTVYSRNELMAKIPNAICMPELPLTHQDNYIMLWKNGSVANKPDPYQAPPQVSLMN